MRGGPRKSGTLKSSTGDTLYRLTNYLHHLASCIIGIECCQNFGPCRQPGDGRLDQCHLPRTWFAAQAGIAALVLRIREQRGMGERVNGTLSQDQAPVGRMGMRQPQPLLAPGGKACESTILDLVSAQPQGIEVWKHRVAEGVDPQAACKPRR